MVRFNLAILALSATALAVTTHNDRRGLEDLDEPRFISRDAPLMDLYKRQVQKQDSPEIQKLKDERKAISPELDQAIQAMRDARKAANAAIPQDLKQKEEAAIQNVKTMREGLPEDKKNQLKENAKAIQAERKKEKASASAPASAPAPSAPDVCHMNSKRTAKDNSSTDVSRAHGIHEDGQKFPACIKALTCPKQLS